MTHFKLLMTAQKFLLRQFTLGEGQQKLITTAHMGFRVITMGLNGPHDHFRSQPHRKSLGLYHKTAGFVSLVSHWHQFILWFSNFSKLRIGGRVFANPVAAKYALLLSLSVSPLSISEWSFVTHALEGVVRRRSPFLQFLVSKQTWWKREISIFPNIANYHPLIRVLTRCGAFSLGLVPLSSPVIKPSYPLFTFDGGFREQLFFINFLRFLWYQFLA